MDFPEVSIRADLHALEFYHLVPLGAVFAMTLLVFDDFVWG